MKSRLTNKKILKYLALGPKGKDEKKDIKLDKKKTNLKATKHLSLIKCHEDKDVIWLNKYMKTNF